MTTLDRLDELDTIIGQTSDADVLRLIGKEVIKLARGEIRDNHVTQDYHLRLMFEARQRERKLQGYLHQALRAWIVHTPDLGEAVHVMRIAREAGL
jgi:2-hydroxychromene-2-carboxylate isomerase